MYLFVGQLRKHESKTTLEATNLPRPKVKRYIHKRLGNGICQNSRTILSLHAPEIKPLIWSIDISTKNKTRAISRGRRAGTRKLFTVLSFSQVVHCNYVIYTSITVRPFYFKAPKRGSDVMWKPIFVPI